MAGMENAKRVVITLLGSPGCGKTTFLRRLSQGNHKTTTDMSKQAPVQSLHDRPFSFNVQLYNRYYTFHFYDTADSSSREHAPIDVAILCYDIADRGSFIDTRTHWYHLLMRNPNEQIPLVLLGMKRDLRGSRNSSISPQEGHALAQEMRCDRYIECSAITGELFGEAFEDIALLAAKTTTENGASMEPPCIIM